MTVDPLTYAFARTRLTQGGWCCDADWMKLAELLQSCCEEYEADLEAQYEKEQTQ